LGAAQIKRKTVAAAEGKRTGARRYCFAAAGRRRFRRFHRSRTETSCEGETASSKTAALICGLDRHSYLDLVDGRFAAAQFQVSQRSAKTLIATHAKCNQLMGNFIARGKFQSRSLPHSEKMDRRSNTAGPDRTDSGHARDCRRIAATTSNVGEGSG